MTRTRGALIAFEGIDGSGKTTQAKLLAEALRRRDLQVQQSKEPTNGPWGQKIRESKTRGRMAPELELQAFLNDRREHVADLIEPSMARGEIVIVDRYYFSTVAYQGARGLDPVELLQRNEAFAPRPDVLVLLDVPPQVGLRRIAQRGDKADLFEAEDNLRRAAEIFASFSGPYVIRLDGTKSIEAVHEAVWRRVRDVVRSALHSEYSYIGEQDAVAEHPELALTDVARG
jgi:dTMP kinase